VAPAVFKTVAGRLASWVGSIPIHSRHRGTGRRAPPRTVTVELPPRRLLPGRPAAAAAIVASLCAGAAHAQRVDTTRAGVTRPSDQSVRPPLSPRRAFLTSLVAPGYAQSVLRRPNASAVSTDWTRPTAAFCDVTEAIALLMVRESSLELREARRLEGDSVPLFFVNPTSGVPDTIYAAPRYSSELVRARRAHLEDWIAALVANHLISAADAFVAAHLWEVPVRVGLRRTPGGALLAARYRW
jgi:hypothetical protein